MSINSLSFTSAPGVKIYNDDASHNIVINPDNINYIQTSQAGKPRLYLNNGASPYFDVRKDMTTEECANQLLKAQKESETTGKIVDLTA